MANNQNEIIIDDVKICYRLYGNGPANLLLLHGAVGSYEDFRLQLDESSNASLSADQFTVVAPDLPGFGRSEVFNEEKRQNCLPTLEYYEWCAEVCAKLMAKLNHKTYSVAGWSDGARVGALLAIKSPSRVDSLILWGFSPVMDKEWCLATARARDTSSWEPSVIQTYSDVYGEQNFSELWRAYVDFVVKTLEMPEQLFDIRSRLSLIKCPTLVLHGSLDPIINYRAHVKPIEMQIYDSQISQFKGLAHNIHQADPAQFNQVLAKFVSTNVVLTSVGA
uniref:Valacyclovir hydrolase n=1 Tax=Aceria tosichella TaxID=561515 RepID=A0A6G1SCS7_9ACAR